jgi:hypothetical protein
MIEHKVPWADIADGKQQFDQYSNEGIEDWHKNRGLLDEG